MGEHLATKQDLLQVKVEINDRIAAVETGIANLKGSFYQQLWIMAAGIVTVNAGMLTAPVMLTRLFPK